MKKNVIIKRIFFLKIFCSLLIVSITTSCKKNESLESTPIKEMKKVAATTSDENLIKFLSATLNVDKAEISYDSVNSNFIIKGQLKLSKEEIESHYNEANISQPTYVK